MAAEDGSTFGTVYFEADWQGIATDGNPVIRNHGLPNGPLRPALPRVNLIQANETARPQTVTAEPVAEPA